MQPCLLTVSTCPNWSKTGEIYILQVVGARHLHFMEEVAEVGFNGNNGVYECVGAATGMAGED